jgi:hypothetical protein
MSGREQESVDDGFATAFTQSDSGSCSGPHPIRRFAPPSPAEQGKENAPAVERGYEVGYGRPPRAARFRPGQSGNPRGRPKSARGLGALVAKALDEKVEAQENGRRRRITKLEAAVTQLVNRAANGDQRATQFVLSLMRDDQGRVAAQAAYEIGEGDAIVVAELVRRLSRPAP